MSLDQYRTFETKEPVIIPKETIRVPEGEIPIDYQSESENSGSLVDDLIDELENELSSEEESDEEL